MHRDKPRDAGYEGCLANHEAQRGFSMQYSDLPHAPKSCTLLCDDSQLDSQRIPRFGTLKGRLPINYIDCGSRQVHCDFAAVSCT
jgi:hypothetical protein